MTGTNLRNAVLTDANLSGATLTNSDGSHANLTGATISVYDNLMAGHREAVERIARAFPERRISLVEGDIRDRARVLAALQQQQQQQKLYRAGSAAGGQAGFGFPAFIYF
jgi:hypothetical protein